jgi:hypothetical protein
MREAAVAMMISEYSFPWLREAEEHRVAEELEHRRIAAERAAERAAEVAGGADAAPRP